MDRNRAAAEKKVSRGLATYFLVVADISSCSLMFTRVCCNLEICYDCASMIKEVRRSRDRGGTVHGVR